MLWEPPKPSRDSTGISGPSLPSQGARGNPGAGCRSRASTPNWAPHTLPNPLLSVLPTASLGQPASPSSPQLCLSPGTGLCLRSKRKPEETNQGAPLPSLPHPPLRPAPGHEAAVTRPSPPDTWRLNSAADRTLPPLPSPRSLFANQDTDSVFNFAMGRVG